MPIYIVIIAIVVVIAIIGYVSISQVLEKNRAQKQRVIMGLKTKYRNIEHMISKFSPRFLPNDLMSMVYTALVDICNQLQTFEPDNNQHEDEITHLNSHLRILAKNHPAQKVTLENPQQVKEIRQNLQELQSFVAQQYTLKLINKAQFETHQEQLQNILFQITIDELMQQAKVAEQEGKARLAVHYYSLAKTQLSEAPANESYEQQIADLTVLIQKHEEEILKNPEPAPASEASNKEWQKWKELNDDTSWQKKQNYD